MPVLAINPDGGGGGITGTGMPVLAINPDGGGGGITGTGMPVLAEIVGVATWVAAKLRSPNALTSTINTKTTNINHLFIGSPRVRCYNSADSMWSCVVKGEMFRRCV